MKLKLASKLPALPILLTLLFVLPPALQARTWTAADGRKLEADFVSATETNVTLKLSTGKTVSIDLAKLSPEDREYVKGLATAPSPPATADKPTGQPTPISGPYAQYVAGEWKQFEGKGGLQCMLFGGTTLDAAKKHPLLIYLHGKGNQVLNQQHLGFAKACASPENYKERPCFILAPQCPDENGWGGQTGVNFLKTLKDVIKNLPVDEDRLYLVGYSMGGYGTFALLNQEPRMFAAGVPIAGSADVSVARVLRRIPVWIFHGEKDDVVKPDGSRAIAKALDKVKTAKYTEYPGEGHGITGKVEKEAELHTWLFAQHRGK